MKNLLQPRFEVIATYPNSNYKVGDILYKIEYATEEWYDNGNVFIIHRQEIEKYPHLFKKLAWWEKRTEKEMPKYIKIDHESNNVIHKIDVTDANNFTIPVKGASYQVAYSSGGTWALTGIKVYLTKTPDVGDSLKVYYYANPLPKNGISDSVDLKDQLIPACIHYTLAHFLMLDGQLQVGSGHYGIAEKIEKEFIQTRNSREGKPDIIPQPLQDFIY